MDQNELAIRLFMFTSALLLGVEAMKAAGHTRTGYWVGAGVFVLLGSFWTPVAKSFPALGAQVGTVAKDPTAWFVLFMTLFLVARGWWAKRTISPRTSPVTAVPAMPHSPSEVTKESLDALDHAFMAEVDLLKERLVKVADGAREQVDKLRSDLEPKVNELADQAVTEEQRLTFVANFAAVPYLKQLLGRLEAFVGTMQAEWVEYCSYMHLTVHEAVDGYPDLTVDKLQIQDLCQILMVEPFLSRPTECPNEPVKLKGEGLARVHAESHFGTMQGRYYSLKALCDELRAKLTNAIEVCDRQGRSILTMVRSEM